MPAKWQQWMPFKIDAFRGSPAVQAMHPAARAGYLYLLCSAWQTEDCTLPNDDMALADMSGLGDELWKQHKDRIMRKFDLGHDDRFRKMVQLAEWNDAKRIYDARRVAADRVNTGRSPSRSPQQSPSHNADTITLTKTDTETRTEEPKKKPAPVALIPDWIPSDAWDGFVEMRKKSRNPLTQKAIALTIRELEKYRAQGEDIEAVLNQSIMKNYRGVFAVSKNGNGLFGQQPVARKIQVTPTRAEMERMKP